MNLSNSYLRRKTDYTSIEAYLANNEPYVDYDSRYFDYISRPKRPQSIIDRLKCDNILNSFEAYSKKLDQFLELSQKLD